jgi:tRNA threonylcarbamoyladenosine biosynthesis protein TsaE
VTTALRTGSATATRELAGIVADHVRGGDLLLLVGDLGAGKTTFVQGFAQALGVDEPVTSPTFTLTRTYPGRLPVHHVDVYRLERMAEVGDLGLGELIDSNGVTLVEWGDVIRAALPASYLEVRLQFGDGADDRTIAIRAVGPVWQARATALATNLAPWHDGKAGAC